MKSFIGWVGGKSILAKHIVSLMPPHRCYVEVFGGAGWVLFKKNPSNIEVWNDLNNDLVNLFRVVRNNLEEFINRQYFLLPSREEYALFTKNYRTNNFKDDIDRAITFYYLIKNSFSGMIFSGWSYSTVRASSYHLDIEHLKAVRERLKRVYIENLSFEKLIPYWDRKETLFYCDPPYFKLLNMKGRQYYQCSFTLDDHIKLRDILKKINGKFILSYDDHPEVKKLYKDFHIIHTEPVRYNAVNLRVTSAKRVSELLITNF